MNDTLSRTLSSIRFPMIIGIIVIHSYVNGLAGFDDTVGQHSWVAAVGYLFSNVFARICVPLFFVISGLLFFYNVKRYSKDVYFSKLKSRAKSLLVPYILWNLIGFGLIMLYRSPLLSRFFPGLSAADIDLKYIMDCFWCHGEVNHSFFEGGGMPVDYPLWFIRNLMILVVLTPVVYFVLSRIPIIYMSALTICWIAGWWPTINGLSITGIYFFSIGAFLGMRKIDPVAELERFRLKVKNWVKISNIYIYIYIYT